MSEILVTTASSFDGYNIEEYVGFLNHEVIFGSNVLQELAANITEATGGEGRDLSDKLQEATDQALSEFKEIAQEKGANAIINAKISYSNISGNVAAVFVSGTACKVKKQTGTLREDVNVIAISNYVDKKIVRPFEVAFHVDGKQVYLSMKMHNYEMTKISAVKVDVILTDLYGDVITLEDIDFVMNQDINILIKTDMVPIDFDVRKVGLQSDAKVIVHKYVKDKVVVPVEDAPKDSSLTSDELKIFKKNKGADAVDKYRKTDTYWRCICGTINLPGDTECSMCNRKVEDFSNGFDFDYEEMLNRMTDEAKSAEEIKDILMQYIKEIKDSDSRVEVLEILQSAINMEKTRGAGAMKYTVIEKLKRKFELS